MSSLHYLRPLANKQTYSEIYTVSRAPVRAKIVGRISNGIQNAKMNSSKADNREQEAIESPTTAA